MTVSAPIPALYRVNLVCACQQDVAYGCEDTIEAARAIAEREFKKHHGSQAKYALVVVEKLADGEKPYFVESEALRYEFTDGLGSELDMRMQEWLIPEVERHASRVTKEKHLHGWNKAFTFKGYDYKGKLPYVYECTEAAMHKPLVLVLKQIADGPGNRKLREAAQRAYVECRKLARHLGTVLV